MKKEVCALTKKKAPKKTGGIHANPVVMGNVAESIKSTKAGKLRKRHERKKKASCSASQKTEHLAQANAGRSSDILKMLEPTPGLYAFPGGNQPSVHLLVEEIVTIRGALHVIRIQEIQKGHILPQDLSTEHYLPYHFVERFGKSFTSQFPGAAGKRLQDNLCRYLAQILAERQVLEERVQEAKEEEQFSERLKRALSDLRPMRDNVFGDYVLEDGTVVELVPSKDPLLGNVKVVRGGEWCKLAIKHNWFVPMKTLAFEELRKLEKASGQMYAWQAQLHGMLREAFAKLPVKKSVQPVTQKPELVQQMQDVALTTSVVVDGNTNPIPATKKKHFTPNVRGAKEFSKEAFLGNEGLYFVLDDEGKKAYLSVEKPTGNYTCTVYHAQKGFSRNHVLGEILLHHEHVRVELLSLSKVEGDKENLREFADLSNIKQAREAFCRYLRNFARGWGLKPSTKKAKERVTVPKVSPEALQALSSHFGTSVSQSSPH